MQLVSALPAIISALQIAAPAAFLGAILGEYVGGIERGVGLALKIAQQNVDVARAWGIGFGCAAGRRRGVRRLRAARPAGHPLVEGSPRMSALSPALVAAGRALLRALLTLVFVVGIVLLLWVAGLRIFEVSDYVGKGPADVWAYLVTDEDAGQTRSEAWSLLVKTLQDAAHRLRRRDAGRDRAGGGDRALPRGGERGAARSR